MAVNSVDVEVTSSGVPVNGGESSYAEKQAEKCKRCKRFNTVSSRGEARQPLWQLIRRLWR